MDMASHWVLGFAIGEHHDAQRRHSALGMMTTVRLPAAPR